MDTKEKGQIDYTSFYYREYFSSFIKPGRLNKFSDNLFDMKYYIQFLEYTIKKIELEIFQERPILP